jgi:phage terminase small subunit
MPTLINQKHEQFVALVAISSESGEDVAKAYTAADYKAKSFHVARSAGFRLLKTVEIRQRLVELRTIPAAGARAEAKFVEVMNDIVAGRKWVLTSLKAVAKRCMQAEPVLDSKGTPTGEYTFQASGANRALELLGKEYGMFVDRTDSVHRFASIVDLLENGTPEQLQTELAELEALRDARRPKAGELMTRCSAPISESRRPKRVPGFRNSRLDRDFSDLKSPTSVS